MNQPYLLQMPKGVKLCTKEKKHIEIVGIASSNSRYLPHPQFQNAIPVPPIPYFACSLIVGDSTFVSLMM